jgi:hypothetical protein
MTSKRFLFLGLALVVSSLSPGTAQGATTRGTFDQPPYYDGRLPAAPEHPAHVPVAFRDEVASLDPTPAKSKALAALLHSLQAEFARTGVTRALPVAATLEGRPDVRFGVRRGGTGPDGMPRSATEIDPGEPRRMTFEVEGPSKAWKQGVAAAMGDSVSVVVSVQLGFDELWVRQKDWKGNKTIAIGTGRAVPVAWLTSLDDPVQVLQLTGAAVDREGKVRRVGAEGLAARRTGMGASVAGLQETLTEDDLRSILGASPGEEPVWRVALRQLITSLLATPRD